MREPLLRLRVTGDADAAVADALAQVALPSNLATTTPDRLSGGQAQRVAIARAMINDPAFILADEPTGNLDSEMTLEVMALFQELNAKGITIVMVTHEPEIACYTTRVVTMRDGSLVSDSAIEERRSAAEDLGARRAKGAA